jgi:hypothetical protein
VKRQGRIFSPVTFVLGILATFSVVYNMVAVQIFKEQVFFDHVVSMPYEFAMLSGALLILLFDVFSLGWVSHKIFATKRSEGLDRIALVWGVLCIPVLMGTKVMADEIAREYRLGWETLGEWIGLYVCLFFQFFYIILIFIHLRRFFRSKSSRMENTGELVRP